jgi:hypothetical protein
LTELVTTTTATSARWGTQWAAAALGLDDAAKLTGRSLAVAEGLPAVFQEKADALTVRLAAVEREAQARLEAGERQEAALTARVEQIGVATTGLQQTLEEISRVEAGLREQRTAITTALAEFPVAAGQAQAARAELDERVAAAPAQLAEHVARMVTEAEARLGATTTALLTRLAEVETMIGSLTEQLQRATDAAAEIKPAPVPAVAPAVVVADAPVVVVETPVAVEPAATAAVVVQEPERVAEAPAFVAKEKAPTAAPVKDKPVVRQETIMDPFLIPDDGYAALAEAMDLDRT